MKAGNNASQAQRFADAGSVWEQKLVAAGSIEVEKFSTFRVRAAAAVTVTIGGILAATMVSGEILIFNTGNGDPTDTKETVTVTTTGNSFVQVARNEPRKV